MSGFIWKPVWVLAIFHDKIVLKKDFFRLITDKQINNWQRCWPSFYIDNQICAFQFEAAIADNQTPTPLDSDTLEFLADEISPKLMRELNQIFNAEQKTTQ